MQMGSEALLCVTALVAGICCGWTRARAVLAHDPRPDFLVAAGTVLAMAALAAERIPETWAAAGVFLVAACVAQLETLVTRFAEHPSAAIRSRGQIWIQVAGTPRVFDTAIADARLEDSIRAGVPRPDGSAPAFALT